MPILGDREKLVFRNFSGVDPRRSGLFPEAYVAQELIERGLLLDARNCRFSRGRAYWWRNQLRIPWTNCPISSQATASTVTLAARVSNVTTCTTSNNHAYAVGDGVRMTSTGGFCDGHYTITGVPAANQFTFADPGVDGNSGAITAMAKPEWPTLVLPFVAGDYDQLLACSDFGSMYFADVDWSDTPAQWAYGYELHEAATWTAATARLANGVWGISNWETSTGVPTAAPGGFAPMRDVLFLCGGVSPGWPHGWPTCFWDGEYITAVGYEGPITAPSGTADATGAGNRLAEGRYSYRVVVGDRRFDSMMGPILDVEVEFAAATAYVEPKSATTPPNHLDTITIDGVTYRFTDLATVQAGGFQSLPYDVICGWSADAATDVKVTYRMLAATIADGHTDNNSGTAIHTPAHPTVMAEWQYVASITRVNITARETGTDGNSIALAESTSDARIHVSAALLSGGTAECHIDLTAIPTGMSRCTHRKLYRAYSASLLEGVRGAEYQLLAVIPNNTATTYADNTPQEELGEAVEFDHAIPPRGNIMVHHRDRLWMAGIAMTSESYEGHVLVAAAPAGAVRVSGVSTLTTTTAHGLKVGDWISVHGVTNTSFRVDARIASVPSTTSLTYAQPTEADATSGGGLILYGIELSELENSLYYSQLDDPWYWPSENLIKVGSTSPIVALCSWHDELLVLKEDSVWVLTGYGETDFLLRQLPGTDGVVGQHVAASPYGVLWAGHGGWELFDGENVRRVLTYSEFSNWTNEVQDFGPPAEKSVSLGETDFPVATWHDGRFYMLAGSRDYALCWSPADDTWEVRHLPYCARLGLRSWHLSTYHAHILTVMRWNVAAAGYANSEYLTVLDSLYQPNNAPNGHYGNTAGTSNSDYFGDVRIELPPIVAEPGEAVRPLDLWVDGRWTLPVDGLGEHDEDADLHLYVSTDEDEAWTDLGLVTQNKRLGIPAGYACPRLRLLLQGERLAHFALQAVVVEYQRRTARGA